MNIKLQLHNLSQPIEYNNVKSSYEKGSMYCLQLENDQVHKYPISTIFRIIEDYGYHSKRQDETKPYKVQHRYNVLSDDRGGVIFCLLCGCVKSWWTGNGSSFKNEEKNDSLALNICLGDEFKNFDLLKKILVEYLQRSETNADSFIKVISNGK